MKMRKLFAVILAASLTTVCAAGCGSKTAEGSAATAGTETTGAVKESTVKESEMTTSKEADGEAATEGKTTTDYSHIEKVKIALIGGASGGNFWGNIETGFNTEIASRGWEGVYWAPSTTGGGDAAVLDLAETALIQGYNVVCPVINDVSIFEDFLTRASEDGVLVIAFNSNPGEDSVIAQVGIDSAESGKQQGGQIADFAKKLGIEEIKYINMCSALSNTNQQATKGGVLEGLAENFGGTVTELGEGESEDNAATAQDAIGSLFIANPDINTIFCIDQYSAVGAASYIEENGLQGKVIACGLSLDSDALQRVKDGALNATSSVDSVYMGGEQLCSVAEAIISGAEFEYKNFPPKIWVLPEDVDAYAAEHGITLN